MACKFQINGKDSALYIKLLAKYPEKEAEKRYLAIYNEQGKSLYGDLRKVQEDVLKGVSQKDSIKKHKIKTPLDENQEPFDVLSESFGQQQVLQKLEENTKGLVYDETLEAYTFNKKQVKRVTNVVKENHVLFKEPLLNFDKDNYISKQLTAWEKTEYLDKNIITNTPNFNVAKDKKKKEFEEQVVNWDKTANIGTKLHTILEFVVTDGLTDIQDISREYLKKYGKSFNYDNEADLKKFIQKGEEIRNKILKNYPKETAKIVAEQKLFNKATGIAGTTDLMVIRENGIVDIYDYKFSGKASKNWSEAKQKTITYQQAMYRNMLRDYGVVVGNLNIIPIQLDIDFETSKVKDFEVQTYIDLILNGELDEFGKIQDNIDKIIKTNFTNILTSNEEVGDIIDTMDSLFNYKIEKKGKVSVSEDEINEFLTNKVKTNSSGDKTFFNQIAQKSITSKNKTAAEFEKEIRTYILQSKEYANNRTKAVEKFVLDSREDIEKGTTSAIYSTNYGINDSFQRNTSEVLKKYIEESYLTGEGDDVKRDYLWDTIRTPQTDELGIILFLNKKTKEINIISLTNKSLDEKVKLNLGETLIGNFVRKGRDENELSLLKNNIGNLECVKSMLFLMKNDKLFDPNVFTIGKIVAISEKSAPVSIPIEQLIDNLKVIYDNKDTNPVLKLEPNKFDKSLYKQDFVKFYLEYLGTLVKQEQLNLGEKLSRKKMMDNINSARFASAETNVLLENRMIELLTKQANFPDSMKSYETKELSLLADAITDAYGIYDFYDESDLSHWGKNIGLGESSQLSNPDDITKKIIRSYIEVVKRTNNRVTLDYVAAAKEFQPFVKELLKENIGDASLNLIGDQTPAYDNMFEYELINEKWNKTMRLRDPDDYSRGSDKQKPLSETERKFIKQFIEKTKAIRAKRASAKAGDFLEDTPENGLKWREIPLVRAQGFNKIRQLMKEKGIKDTVYDAMKTIYDDILNPENALSGDESYQEARKVKVKMADLFSYMEVSENRQKFIDEQGTAELESNLELILNSYMFNTIRVEKFNESLPLLHSIKAKATFAQEKWFKAYPEIKDFLNHYEQTVIFKNPIISENDKLTMKVSSTLKNVTSNMLLGFNIKTGIVQFLTGLYNNISVTNSGQRGLTLTNYTKAGKVLFGAGAEVFDNVGFINQLTHVYGINHPDTSRLMDMMSEDKTGVFAWKSRWLHWLNSSPDWFHRTQLFLAEMVKDGVIKVNGSTIDMFKSAYTFDKKTLKISYNPEKDERFKDYFHGVKDSESYLKAKALYERLLIDMSEEDGQQYTVLPRPYTGKQRDSMVKFANRIHGDFSSENKIRFAKSAMGSLMTQFKTWMFGIKNRYYKDYRKDTFEGKYEAYQDIDGSWKQHWVGTPMEGIWQTFVFIAQDLKVSKGNLWSTAKNIRDYQKQNLKWLASDMMLFLLLFMLKEVFEIDDLSAKNDIDQQALRILYSSGKDLFVYNTVESVLSERNPIASISYLNKVGFQTLDYMFDGEIVKGFENSFIENTGLGKLSYDIYDMTMQG